MEVILKKTIMLNFLWNQTSFSVYLSFIVISILLIFYFISNYFLNKKIKNKNDKEIISILKKNRKIDYFSFSLIILIAFFYVFLSFYQNFSKMQMHNEIHDLSNQTLPAFISDINNTDNNVQISTNKNGQIIYINVSDINKDNDSDINKINTKQDKNYTTKYIIFLNNSIITSENKIDEVKDLFRKYQLIGW